MSSMKKNMRCTSLCMLFVVQLPHQSHVIQGYFLPSKRLDLARRLPHVKNSFSKKFTETNELRNFAHNDKTTPTSDDRREASIKRKRRNYSASNKETMAGTLNLIKAMVGTGILALPMGVAKSSDFRTSIIPAITLMWILGAISAYTFILYGRLIHISQAKSLGELWENKMGKRSGMNRILFCCIFIHVLFTTF